MVLHHLEEALGARLHGWVGDKEHLHQLGDQVWVLYVVLTANEDHQECDDVFSAWLIQDLGEVPEKQNGLQRT